VALLSKAYVCGHLIAGIVESNPTDGTAARLLCSCFVVTALGNGPITRSEESYLVCVCLNLRYLET
jgi:hypothetical protein